MILVLLCPITSVQPLIACMLLCLVLIKLLQQSVLSICASASTRITNTVTARLKQQTHQSTKENTCVHSQAVYCSCFIPDRAAVCVCERPKCEQLCITTSKGASLCSFFTPLFCFFSSLSYLRSALHCPYTAMFLQVGCCKAML